MARIRRPTTAAIGANPALHPRAFTLVQERFPGLDWHLYAHSPDSSQAFALSAFLPVLEFPDRDAIFEELVGLALSDGCRCESPAESEVNERLGAVARRADRSWSLIPEYSCPHLLGESGPGEATKIDILLVADDAVVCVESKFRVDARQGWGKCSQPTLLCKGFHGRGSDRKGTSAWCRLERSDGNRGPRHYWELGRGHFREEVFLGQGPGDVCPFRNDYQLMRNYLFAAEYARRGPVSAAVTARRAPRATGPPRSPCVEPHSGAWFGVIGVAPVARAGALATGVERFRSTVLLPANAHRVAFVAYERYIALLAGGSAPARGLASFLAALLD